MNNAKDSLVHYLDNEDISYIFNDNDIISFYLGNNIIVHISFKFDPLISISLLFDNLRNNYVRPEIFCNISNDFHLETTLLYNSKFDRFMNRISFSYSSKIDWNYNIRTMLNDTILVKTIWESYMDFVLLSIKKGEQPIDLYLFYQSYTSKINTPKVNKSFNKNNFRNIIKELNESELIKMTDSLFDSNDKYKNDKIKLISNRLNELGD